MAVRMSVNLSDQVAQTLKDSADKNCVSVTEQVRRAISTEVWREKVEESGGKVLVEDKDGRVREVSFQR